MLVGRICGVDETLNGGMARREKDVLHWIRCAGTQGAGLRRSCCCVQSNAAYEETRSHLMRWLGMMEAAAAAGTLGDTTSEHET